MRNDWWLWRGGTEIPGVAGVAAAIVVVVVTMVLTPAHAADPPHWAVFRLAGGDGDGDTDTRLTVSLNESLAPAAPPPLASFTLCIWYYVTSFLDASTLLSYATSNQMDDAVRFRPIPGEFKFVYMDKSLDVPMFSSLITPNTWHSTCMVLEPNGWALWMDKNVSRMAVATQPLPVDGFLVLGQEQDLLDGGYTKEQSFQGHVTGLTLWPLALSAAQILDWTSCIMPDDEPLLAWNNITWTVHNLTGDVSLHNEGPCGEDGVNTRSILIFPSRMLLKDAKNFLNIIGFDLVVPRDDREIKTITKLINENRQLCPLKVVKGFGAMLGITKDNINATTAEMMRQRIRDRDKKELHHIDQIKCVVQKLEGIWLLTDGDIKMCFVGTPRGRTVFRLRGLSQKLTEDVSPLTFSFVLTRHRNKGVYFHGFKKLHIMKDANASRWCLTGNVLPERLCVDVEGLPVGRHEWMVDRHSEGMKLSLSTCANHQYTCSDATCVQLDKVCDYEFDCSDQSDEADCTTALVLPGYLPFYPPSVPLPVLAHVNVKRIINFNLLSMTFQVNLEVKLYWRDPRVTFTHLQPGQPRKVVVAKGEVWKANLMVEDAVDNTQISSVLLVEQQGPGRPTDTGYLYPGAENPMEEKVTLRSSVYCEYKLRWYPWDVQHCRVRLQVYNARENGLLLNESSSILECPNLLEEYKVESCTLRKVKTPTNTITVDLHLSRRYEYHLFTTFLPTSLLLILGYGTLLLPVESFNERGTMSLTTLLVFISLYTETSSSLPSTAYLKYIDVWFVFSITFLSVIIIVHLATFSHRLAHSPAVAWPIETDSRKAMISSVTSRKILRAGNLILFPILVIFSVLYFLCLVAL